MSTDKVELHKWQKMMMSWDPRGGLQLYVDGVKVDSTTEYRRHAARSPSDHIVYVGRPTDDTPDGRHGDFTLKELQFWYAYVDVLDQFNIKAAGEQLLSVWLSVRLFACLPMCERVRYLRT